MQKENLEELVVTGRTEVAGTDFAMDIAPLSAYHISCGDVTANIMLYSGGEEKIKITPDGFYVRGIKVEQGEGEARAVYDGFVALLNGNKP